MSTNTAKWGFAVVAIIHTILIVTLYLIVVLTCPGLSSGQLPSAAFIKWASKIDQKFGLYSKVTSLSFSTLSMFISLFAVWKLQIFAR